MQQAGNRCDLEVNEGGRHGYLMFDRELYEATLTKTEKFLASLDLLPGSKVQVKTERGNHR
jgi:hypothetical protein